MNASRTRFAFAVALLSISSVALPAYSQTDPSKTGVGPRGTAVGPSTQPQPGSAPPVRTDSRNLPPAVPSHNQSTAKPNQPAQGTGR